MVVPSDGLTDFLPFRFECRQAGFHSFRRFQRETRTQQETFNLEQFFQTQIDIAGVQYFGSFLKGLAGCGT